MKKQDVAKKMMPNYKGKKGKMSLNSTGKNMGEKMYLGKNENNQA